MSGESNESWFIFGEAADGTVDIASQRNDTEIACVPRELAERIIAAHDAAVERLCARIRELGGGPGYK